MNMWYNGDGGKADRRKEQEAMKQGITIQERLKDLRTERHLKLEELAAVTGISKSA